MYEFDDTVEFNDETFMGYIRLSEWGKEIFEKNLPEVAEDAEWRTF